LFVGRDDGSYARSLVECMQVQAKVYEEWVEVMRDYSTVFCMNSNQDDSLSAASPTTSKGRLNSRQRTSIESTSKDDEINEEISDDNRTAIEKSGDVSFILILTIIFVTCNSM
jgi:hypothetical protein